MYVHRPDLKYHHQVWQSRNIINRQCIDQIDTFYWCKENFGNYGKRWMNPPSFYEIFYINQIWDENHEFFEYDDMMFYPYRFKNLIDAMAFELRWN